MTLASGLVVSYVPQDTAGIAGSLTDFAAENGIDRSLFFAILRKMGLRREQFERNLSDYSAGQKKILFLAKSLCQQAHLYIWDEPLNYIDLYTRMQIERLLLSALPTMVFVEHDQAFQKAVATRRISL